MFQFNYILQAFIIGLLFLIKSSDAGTSNVARVVDGELDEISSIPSLVQLYINKTMSCTGSLVSDIFVVTAARCVYKAKASQLIVKAGATTLLEDGIPANVSQIFVPKGFNITAGYKMDVAVLKLKEPIKGPQIQPAVLCTEQAKHGDYITAYGWGTDNRSSLEWKNQLESVEMRAVDTKQCEKFQNKRTRKTKDTMFCAAAPGKGLCVQDYGAPAMFDGKLCAIMSNINSVAYCVVPGYPSIFTDLTNRNVSRFIKTAMKQ